MHSRQTLIMFVGLSILLGCTETDLSSDRFFCVADFDCKNGYTCHPVDQTCVPLSDVPDGGFVDLSISPDAEITIPQEDGDTVNTGESDTVGPACDNGKQDPNETGRDCGGECEPCSPGSPCLVPSDCDTSVCLENVCQPPSCGDGVVNGDETCDDGNADDADGCDSFCQLARCGDGIVNSPLEQCDDGNSDDTDDCLSNCARARCGDNVVQRDQEACDDGNIDSTDGCTNLCELPRCGDGFLRQGFEECDDGNQQDGDGCTNECFLPRCGDGVVQNPEEACDDANSNNQDACLNNCQIATCGDGVILTGVEECDDANPGTDTCHYGEESCTVCSSECRLIPGAVRYCGDAIVDEEEGCDDGNELDTDACLSDCSLARCGDGILQSFVEQCDTAGVIETECEYGLAQCTVCSDTCVLQAGNPHFCGDGIIDPTESCDTSGIENLDCEYGLASCTVCNLLCQFQAGRVRTCGDGRLDVDNETCDDGNVLSGDGCDETCLLEAVCGNGIVEMGEDCDDGNPIEDDVCSNNCISNVARAMMPVELSPCNVVGPTGPTQADCDLYYGVRMIRVLGGIQHLIIPDDGVYRITADGAQGGARGGLGASVAGVFELQRGDILSALVGQVGGTLKVEGTLDETGGGGGGSFVSLNNDALLLAAAGGGGGDRFMTSALMDGSERSAGNSETNSESPWDQNAPGQNGHAATGNLYTGHGGCGYLSGFNGEFVTTIANLDAEYCQSFLNGGAGGQGNSTLGKIYGGFGGGGIGDADSGDVNGGGGGGGYSGGAGGGVRSLGSPGGGGGSYNLGFDQANRGGVQFGDGRVSIVLLATDGFGDQDGGNGNDGNGSQALSVELTFEPGADFDLHLAHPLAQAWFDRDYDCFFENFSPDWGRVGYPNDDGLLTLDDTGVLEGTRTESLVLLEPESTDESGGVPYRIGVHMYSTDVEGAQAATVTIRIGDRQVFTGSRTMRFGDMWSVADVVSSNAETRVNVRSLTAAMNNCDPLVDRGDSCSF